MLRVSFALVLTAACHLAYAQQALDDETPGAHKKVAPPPPSPAPPAVQPAPKAEKPAPAPAEDTKKGKKGKNTRKKKGEKVAPASAAPPAEPPAPEPPPVTPAAPAAAAEPAPAPQVVEAPPPVATAKLSAPAVAHDENTPYWSGSFRLRYVTVPGFLEFSQINHALNSAAFGFEGVRRKGDADIVFGLEFAFFGPEDGNWLGNGKNPSSDTEFLQFKHFDLISLEVTWIWHHPLNNFAQLEWGVGGGLGIPTGQLLRVAATGGNCGSGAADPTQCYPSYCNGPCTDAVLAMHQAPADCHDKSCAGGNQFVDSNVPPVIPIIHLLVGAVFQVAERVRLRVEGGFHDSFFLGAATEYSL